MTWLIGNIEVKIWKESWNHDRRK